MEDQVTRLQLAQTKEYLDLNDISLITGFSLSTLHRRVKRARKLHDVPNMLRPLVTTTRNKLLFSKQCVNQWVSNGAN